jgi:hypothetical protein
MPLTVDENGRFARGNTACQRGFDQRPGVSKRAATVGVTGARASDACETAGSIPGTLSVDRSYSHSDSLQREQASRQGGVAVTSRLLIQTERST